MWYTCVTVLAKLAVIKLSSEGCLEEEVIFVISTVQSGVGSRRVD